MSVKVRPYRRGGWEVDLTFRLPNGLRHRERSKAPGSSKSAAQRWGENRERHLLQHGLAQPIEEVPTLQDFASRFVEGHVKANRQKPSGIVATESILRCHLVPALGPMRLDAITSEQVQKLKLTMAGRAPKTVNNCLVVLSTLLKKAVEWQVIQGMPCVIRWVKVPPPAATFHDFEDFERLVETARKRSLEAYLVVLLGGEAGLRRGEIAALQWNDIDFKQRRLCVSRSVWRGHVEAPKGGRLRHVPLTRRLTEALQAARHLRGPWVFADSNGGRASENVIANHVDHAARAAKLQARGVHVLRHTFCSHLAMHGAPARSIQELAGHAELRTTQRYMHLSPVALSDAIRLLDSPAVEVGRGDTVETTSQRSIKSL